VRLRTGFSFRNAVGSVPAVIDRLKALGYDHAPITDRASTFGFCQWRKATGKAGLRPIYGVEIGVTSGRNEKKPAFDYWTFIAIDNITAINDLVNVATHQFRYEPQLDYRQAMGAKGVFIIAGNRPHMEAMREGLEAGLPLPFFPISPSTQRGALMAAFKIGMPLILANDNRYPTPDDKALYETICGRNASIQTYPQWIVSYEELIKNAERLLGPEGANIASNNYQKVMAASQAELRIATLLTPNKPKTLREMCVDGAVYWKTDLTDPVYAERLDRELAMIAEKDFEDYFYIIADAVQWARNEMLVGPARGSSCGSLVCYLLKITTVDPIPFGLIFERFIDVNRDDLPDIDIDFADTKRELVFDYMRTKYGDDRIARLGTTNLYRPRSAINDACAALKVPKWETQALVDSIIERSSGDARAMNTIEDTFNETQTGRDFIAKYPQIRIAQRMEGHPKHNGQHAAGIVVTADPVNTYVAVDDRSGSLMCDKKDAEELNLLKIDALGLTQLSILQDVLEMLSQPLNFFDTLPLDDQAAFDVLNKGHYAGIFQFMGKALQSLARNVQIDHLEDIVSITALARPGPMASGGANDWVKRKNGSAPVTYPHEAFRPYTENSMGIIIYQEQVMEIGRNIGNLSWGDVTELRKAMSKSLGKEYFDKFGDRWKAGAIANGVPADRLEKIWDDMCAYGSWSFNRSHSVAYGLISYYCCWAKAHHPYEFAAATMTHEADPDKKIKMLRELADEGIGYIPFSRDHSIDKWAVGERDGQKVLVGPVNGIFGVGPKMAKTFMEAKAKGIPMTGKLAKLVDDPELRTDVDTIWPVRDRIKAILPDPRERNIYTHPTSASHIIPNGDDQEVVVFVKLNKIAPRDYNDLQNVAKRGYKMNGPSWKLNLRIADDTEEMLAMVGRYDYDTLGREILDRGGAGKVLYAMKGIIMKDFKMMVVKRAIFLGEIE
jgi:DNA-directed DNA polymerase III PolC